MKIETVISILGLLGLGGVLGSYFQNLWNRKNQIAIRNQQFKEQRYHNILGFMRCYCEPAASEHHEINDNQGNRMDLLKLSDIERNEFLIQRLVGSYYHIILYAPDNVLNKIKQFINNPNKENWIEAALEMRKDLWGKTKINSKELSI